MTDEGDTLDRAEEGHVEAEEPERGASKLEDWRFLICAKAGEGEPDGNAGKDTDIKKQGIADFSD